MNELSIPTCVTERSWKAFVELRRRKGSRAPLTEYGAELVARKLLEAHQAGYDCQYMLDQAIENGWSTVYVRPDTPKVSRAAQETQKMLADRQMTAEQRAASEEARKRAMSALRRVS